MVHRTRHCLVRTKAASAGKARGQGNGLLQATVVILLSAARSPLNMALNYHDSVGALAVFLSLVRDVRSGP